MERFREYKTVADFNQWRKENKDVEVYCIYDSAGNELFDVAEDDFVKLLDLGMVDGDTRQLRADMTENEIEGLCAGYGILWTDKNI